VAAVSYHPLLLAPLKRERLPPVEVPLETVQVIDERLAGLWWTSMQDHPGDLNRTIAAALRNAYLQGFADAARVGEASPPPAASPDIAPDR
jgi:hypothetical protein